MCEEWRALFTAVVAYSYRGVDYRDVGGGREQTPQNAEAAPGGAGGGYSARMDHSGAASAGWNMEAKSKV